MTVATEHLLEAVLALPEIERLDFVEALIASLNSDDRPPVDDLWQGIVQRRSAELQSGQVTPLALSEVRKKLRESFSG